MSQVDQTDLDVAAVLGASAAGFGAPAPLWRRPLTSSAGVFLTGGGAAALVVAVTVLTSPHTPSRNRAPARPSGIITLAAPTGSAPTADMLILKPDTQLAGSASGSALLKAPTRIARNVTKLRSQSQRQHATALYRKTVEIARRESRAREVRFAAYTPGAAVKSPVFRSEAEIRLASSHPPNRPEGSAGMALRGRSTLAYARLERTEALDAIWSLRQR